MATATDEETGNIISNSKSSPLLQRQFSSLLTSLPALPGQERGDVAFVGAEEHGQSTSNIKNSEGNLSAQSPQNIEGTEDGMSAASIKSNENNALALTEKAPAEELRTKCGYNTGHGDFCFGRYVDRNDEVWEKYDLDDTVWNEKDWIEGSNGVPNSIGPIERNRLER
jgi:hypothetical protein